MLVAEGANLVADVLVGTVVGTGVAMLTLIKIFIPATSLLASVMVGFRRRIDACVLLKLNAMARSESPSWIMYSICVPGSSFEMSMGVAVGKTCPGAGIMIFCPGMSGQVPTGKLFNASRAARSTLNLMERSQQVSLS